MNIAGIYSFNNGKEVVESEYTLEFSEIKNIIRSIDSERCRTKISREKKQCLEESSTIQKN